MNSLVSLFLLLLAFQLISASQYYPETSSQKEEYPGNYTEQGEKQPENYSEQKEEQTGNYSEQKQELPGNYSEQNEERPENYSKKNKVHLGTDSDKKDQSGNYSEQKGEHPGNYSKQKEEEQSENYSEQKDDQPGNYPEQKEEEQPENYSKQKEDQPGNYSEQKEAEQLKNYSEQKQYQTGNYPEQKEEEQPENYSEQKEDKPGNYSAQKEEEYDGNYSKEKDRPSLTIPTLLDNLPSADDLLSFVHYHQSCPQAESIINRKVNEWFKKDYSLAASLLRLHFHDCAVRGCDASILLDHEGSERRAEESKSLRGFEVIDDIKAEIEKECPETVSCADILTAASRDATVLLGGPYWAVPYGRKDGKLSVDKEVELVPMGLENITSLIEFYQSNGLNILDLVVLSGAHTIGRATCGSIQQRLYNFEGTGKPDPSLDTQYLNFLTRKCRWASEYVDLDGTTPTTFDNEYYKNLQKNMGLLSSDQLLFSDPRTAPLVNTFASAPQVFYHQFGVSMAKLGNILVPSLLDDGEIRTVCSSVNSDHY
ncbi:peroxidase 7 [Ricinus communis]|uniref:peroxidase 7 n=1 Tax=Ricinus communis TaxID=3988 RepID=UPI00201AA066|nr:peroxidase 7 [Ricinus communis]